jgi:hypothetical protein
MRTRLRSRITLLFLTCTVLMLVVPAMAFAQTSPTIQSDKDDYAPGSTVTLTGSGWQPGESVHINVNDDQGQTWSRDVDVTADASGNITDQFQLPNTFVALYKVTATGAQSGVATTYFTDGNVTFHGVNPQPTSWDAKWTEYGSTQSPNTNCSGTGGTTVTKTITNPTPARLTRASTKISRLKLYSQTR